MRLELQPEQVGLLKEMLVSLKEIANNTEDDVQLSYYIQIDKLLNRVGYANFKNHQAEFLWYLADSGGILAQQAFTDAQAEETKEKAKLVDESYQNIKKEIERAIISVSPKKVK